ncbi:MAG: hypothetical protein HYS21_12625 [Deltaproteobacteria bacterium]|nr:hypothetical protein [Deltaproteobacteria bacterium]
MKKFVISFFILLSLFLEGGATAKMKEDPNIFMKIFFIPFKVSTYIPVTMDHIEERSLNTIWFAKNHVFGEEIKKILESSRTDKKIDNKIIRLKVEFLEDNHKYYIDQNGIVLKDDKINYLLSKEEMSKLEKSILYFSEVIDLKAARKIFKESEKELDSLHDRQHPDSGE